MSVAALAAPDGDGGRVRGEGGAVSTRSCPSRTAGGGAWAHHRAPHAYTIGSRTPSVCRRNTIGVQAYTVGSHAYTVGVHAYTVGSHAYTIGVHAYTIGVQAYTIGVQAYTIGVHAHATGAHAIDARVRSTGSASH